MQNDDLLDSLIKQGFSKTILERFWKNVFIMTYDKGCWIWTAGLFGDPNQKGKGHGKLSIGGRPSRHILAHRFSWLIHNGPIPEGKCVLHDCDVPQCVRPDHLHLGTLADNNREMFAKQRAHTKLSWGDIPIIKTLYFDFGMTGYAIGPLFNVSAVVINGICNGTKWKYDCARIVRRGDDG